MRKGTVAPGALAVVLLFAVALSSIAFLIIQFNHYYASVKLSNIAASERNRERLEVVIGKVLNNNVVALNVTNIGPATSIIVGWVKVSPDKAPTFTRFEDEGAAPITLHVSGAVSIPVNAPVGWAVGVWTSSGNVFWAEAPQTGGGGSGEGSGWGTVPPGEPVYVTFDANLGADASGVVLVVDGVGYSRSDLPKAFRWASGETHTFEWRSPVSGSTGVRYVWSSTSGLSTAQSGQLTVNSNGYVIATYNAQYALTISVSPSGAGTTNPAPGTYWHNPGDSVQISAAANSGYAFDCWVGSGTGSYSGTSGSATITVNGPITQTAYFFSFSISVSPNSGLCQPGGSATATVTVTLIGGYYSVTVSLSASGLPSGASASFSPSSVTVSPSSPTATSMMAISTSSTTPEGAYTITIAGSGGGLMKTTTYTLTVAIMYTISFQILDDGGSSVNGATLIFDGISYSHGSSTSKPLGSYSLSTGTIPSGYRFMRWVASGGISIASPTSPSTTATVSGAGSITMRLQRWLSGWSYRAPVTITNYASRVLNQFPVLVTVDTASLISAGKMRSDGGDIRFTDGDGVTPLPYWVESGLNTANTRIWVLVPSIPSSSSVTIYMYYGNPSATSQSSSSAVFGWSVSSRFTSADFDSYYDAFILSSRQWLGGGTNIGLYGDDAATTLTLPFSAYIYAEEATVVSVSTNGLIRWDGVADFRFSNYLDISYKIITAHWDDLYIYTDYRSDAGVYVMTGASTLGNYYCIRWATTYYGSGFTPADFQVLLFENGHILFNVYRTWSSATPNEYIARGDGTNYVDLTSRWRQMESVLFILVNPNMVIAIGSEQSFA